MSEVIFWGAVLRVSQAVVQAVLPPLPELDRHREHSIAAPVWRTGDIVLAIPSCKFLHAAIELLSTANDPALRRCPGTQAAAVRTTLEIDVRPLARDPFHVPLDSNLSVQLRPVKDESRLGVRFQLLRFAAFIIGEKTGFFDLRVQSKFGT